MPVCIGSCQLPIQTVTLSTTPSYTVTVTNLSRIKVRQHDTGGATVERCHEDVDDAVNVMKWKYVKNDVLRRPLPLTHHA